MAWSVDFFPSFRERCESQSVDLPNLTSVGGWGSPEGTKVIAVISEYAYQSTQSNLPVSPLDVPYLRGRLFKKFVFSANPNVCADQILKWAIVAATLRMVPHDRARIINPPSPARRPLLIPSWPPESPRLLLPNKHRQKRQ